MQGAYRIREGLGLERWREKEKRNKYGMEKLITQTPGGLGLERWREKEKRNKYGMEKLITQTPGVHLHAAAR